MERELYAKNLDAGERVIWKRWLEEKNEKEGRRSRFRAPCCGKSTFRYKMVQNENGAWFCRRCVDAPPNGNYAQTQTDNDGSTTPDTSSCGYEQTEFLPPMESATAREATRNDVSGRSERSSFVYATIVLTPS